MLTKLAFSLIGRLKRDRVKQRSLAILELPPPERGGGGTLMSLLGQRRSTSQIMRTARRFRRRIAQCLPV
jgi:hypothetical protein